MIGEMAITAAKVLLAEIRDEIKAAAEHFSTAGGRLCLDHTSNAEHAAGLFKIVVNDPTEICFVVMTGQLQSYGKIVLTNAGGVSQVRVNSNFLCEFNTS